MWENDSYFKSQVSQSDPELTEVLNSKDSNRIEKVIGKRIQDQLDTKKKE